MKILRVSETLKRSAPRLCERVDGPLRSGAQRGGRTRGAKAQSAANERQTMSAKIGFHIGAGGAAWGMSVSRTAWSFRWRCSGNWLLAKDRDVEQLRLVGRTEHNVNQRTNNGLSLNGEVNGLTDRT